MKADRNLAGAFLASHPAEAAPILEGASAEASGTLLGLCSPPVIAGALQRMGPAEAAAVLSQLPAERASATLTELSPCPAAQLLRSLASSDRARLLDAAPEETARSVRAALRHPEKSAGALMDANVHTLPSEINVGEARRRVRRRSRRTGNYVYVVDGQRGLVGAIGLSQLLLASPGTRIASLMRPTVVRVPAQAGLDRILDHEGWRELHALPVVDTEGVLVGVLRRETFERIRAERSAPDARAGGLGMALAELAWTAMAATVEGLTGALGEEELEHPSKARR